MLSDVIRCSQMLSDALRCSQMLLDALTCSQMLSDAFTCSQTLANALRCSRILSDPLRCYVVKECVKPSRSTRSAAGRRGPYRRVNIHKMQLQTIQDKYNINTQSLRKHYIINNWRMAGRAATALPCANYWSQWRRPVGSVIGYQEGFSCICVSRMQTIFLGCQWRGPKDRHWLPILVCFFELCSFLC